MPSESIPATLRRRVRERANGLCEYCQSPDSVSNASFHCDHILPRTAGGKPNYPIWRGHAHGAIRTNTPKHMHVIYKQVEMSRSLIPDSNNGNDILCGVKTTSILSDARGQAELRLML